MVHNIVEGMCVAIVGYYITGSRVKAFLLTSVLGVPEPLGKLCVLDYIMHPCAISVLGCIHYLAFSPTNMEQNFIVDTELG